jgi:lysophospholipase L1-like esterase
MTRYLFDFGILAAEAGYTKVGPDTFYSSERGYGFAPGSSVFGRNRGRDDLLKSDFCIPQRAVFLLDVPDGVYRITLLTGDALADTSTVIRAGDGSFIMDRLDVPAGQYLRESFSVCVRNGQLRLTFSGPAPRINALDIQPDKEALVLYLAGDSTVADQGEAGYPYAGWGQLLPACFKAGAAIDNRAVSGRSSKSFVQEGHLEDIMKAIRPRDYLFIQFGHNDSKGDEVRHTEPDTTYKEHLMLFISAARDAGAYPVLVTPVHRRRFDKDGAIIPSHGKYPEAMRTLSAEQNVPLIDLEQRSCELFEAYGPERTKELFMWTYPGEYIHHPAGVQDDTHFQVKGAQLVSQLIVEGILEAGLHDLIIYLRHPELTK